MIAARESISTPTLVIAAQDDMMVNTAHNSIVLEKKKLALGSDNGLAVAVVGNGNHVAFDMIYGWQTASSIYRSFILSHSPELTKNKSSRVVEFDGTRAELSGTPLWTNERYDVVTYEYAADSENLTVDARVFSPYAACLMVQDPTTAPAICFRSISYTIPFASVKGSPSWAKIPRTDSEAESMTRWANTNLKMVGTNGKSIVGSNEEPSAFRWVSYGDR
jgi:hypothetical protein